MRRAWARWLQGQRARAPAPGAGKERREGEWRRDLGPPQPQRRWPLPFPCAGAELGQSLPSACLLAGGTACTCVGKLPASQQAILSPAPFMAPEVSGGGWRTALARDVNGNAEHGRAVATTPSLARASGDVSLRRLAAHPTSWPPSGFLLHDWTPGDPGRWWGLCAALLGRSGQRGGGSCPIPTPPTRPWEPALLLSPTSKRALRAALPPSPHPRHPAHPPRSPPSRAARGGVGTPLSRQSLLG